MMAAVNYSEAMHLSVVKNIAVVGAGIAGSLAAYKLIKQGYSVTVYESDQLKQSCSFTAAGMLAPMAELETADSGVYQLGVKSLSMWPAILNQLEQDHDEKIFFNDQGTLVVHHTQDQGCLDQFIASLQSKLGSEFSNLCEQVSVSNCEPDLINFSKGILLKNEAQLDSHQLLNALHRVIKVKGKWLNQKVNSISPKSISLSNGCTHPYDWVFDCRGLAASKDINGLHGIRGERILVHAPQVNINRMVRLMHPRYRLYIAPRDNDHYVIGATELESSDNGPISVRSALELLSAAFSLHSGFAEARIIDMRTGLRPTRFDHQPFLKTKNGLTVINGFYRHGFLIAPAVIKNALHEFTESINKNGLTNKPVMKQTEVNHESYV